ncbi:MAG TPA: HD domain-containing phosphohydrolase [Dehalococcoidia bacterium]|nr:HD domain-containing phosphohydrolase [Dehalococcoidia bacterium]
MIGRIDDLDVLRPHLRVVGGSEFEPPPQARLVTISPLQLEQVRAVCDAALEQNVACCEDPTPAYAVALAGELGLATESVETVLLGAVLRDVGKLRVSRRVLFGLRPMTQYQLNYVRMHAEYSAQICESLELPPAVAEVVRTHHERWDGSGYVNGLKGVEVSLEGRIVALVDAYDSLTRRRLGKKCMSPSKALQELHQGAWRLYDPHLVDAWEAVVGPGKTRGRV